MKVKETAKKPYGICPASMTIWNADQTYNKKGMEKYLTWLLDNGAQSISICGSTGENVAMNMEEQREIIGHVASFLNDQVPLICGTGRYDTLNTIKMSKYAQDCGADGVMVILPYYLNPHKKAVMQPFRDIRAALDIRMMIYNNPWFAGYEMTVPEIEELVNDGTIQDIKAAHGDPNRVHELKFHLGDKLNVFYGHDYCALEGLLVGADGCPASPPFCPSSAAPSWTLPRPVIFRAPSRPRTTSSPISTTSSTTRSTACPTGRRSASTPCRLRAWTSPVCSASPWASWMRPTRRRSKSSWPTWTDPAAAGRKAINPTYIIRRIKQ